MSASRHPINRAQRRALASRDARKRDIRAARKAARSLVSWRPSR
jgi:hypothetical protein